MQVKDLDENFENLLEAAELNARSAWEMNFTADIREKYSEYEDTMFISSAQLDRLHVIADR
jgi:hypothetical protein